MLGEQPETSTVASFCRSFALLELRCRAAVASTFWERSNSRAREPLASCKRSVARGLYPRRLRALIALSPEGATGADTRPTGGFHSLRLRAVHA